MVMITHDLGVVAGRADRVAVMYAGRVVETAPTRELFTTTRHPYTEALLQSIPKIEQSSHTRLEAITGRPPDLVAPPVGCRFAPRCRYAEDRCLVDDPALTATDTDQHAVACWFPVGTEAGEAALARNLAAGHTAAGLTVARRRHRWRREHQPSACCADQSRGDHKDETQEMGRARRDRRNRARSVRRRRQRQRCDHRHDRRDGHDRWGRRGHDRGRDDGAAPAARPPPPQAERRPRPRRRAEAATAGRTARRRSPARR